MSRYAENLGRAARMLKRLDDIGGPSELEGVSLKEIIDDVLTAQNHAFMDEAIGRIRVEPDNVVDLQSRKVFACNPDESGGLA
jgi:hypothetical protein